jgi:hypothetical protein
MIGADVAGREVGLGSNDHGCPGPDPRAGVKAREAPRVAGLALTPSTDQAGIRVDLGKSARRLRVDPGKSARRLAVRRGA